MKPDEFDLQLMDELSQLPPSDPEVEDYTPWQASIRKIIWGMVLVTFRLEFFYLQYLLPLLGATLLYLGYRSLRKSDPWFTLCWWLSAFLLVMVSPVRALIFLIFLSILQQIEGNVIYPRVWVPPSACRASGADGGDGGRRPVRPAGRAAQCAGGFCDVCPAEAGCDAAVREKQPAEPETKEE